MGIFMRMKLIFNCYLIIQHVCFLHFLCIQVTKAVKKGTRFLKPTEVRTRNNLLAGLRCTNYATVTTVETAVLIVLLISLHVTSRLDRNKHECFLLGKCVRTGPKTVVVNGRNQEPLALLRLASGPPMSAANSCDKFFCLACLIDERQTAKLIF